MTLTVAPGLELPLDAVARTFAILGDRGSGKTSTGVVMAEEMSDAGAQFYVVDPTGAWWGLRHPAEGRKRGGKPVVILGGDYGDLPLEATAGQLVAETLIAGSQSLVLDLSLLRKGAQVRFLADFAEALYHGNREALHGFWDEADRAAPQSPREKSVETMRLLGALEDIVKLGRRKGLGATLITQRPQTLNKTVLEECATLVAHRVTAPRKREALKAWIEAQGDPEGERTMLASLARLGDGEAWWWSPQYLDVFERVRVRPKTTFDSSATPEVGATVRAPERRARIDLDELRDRMAETVERAKANDPKALKRRVAELTRELEAERAREPEPAPAPDPVEVPVLDPERVAELREAVEGLRDRADAAREQAEKMTEPLFDTADSIQDALERLERAAAARVETASGTRKMVPAQRASRPSSAPSRSARPTLPIERRAERRAEDNGEVELKAGALRMLEALASLHPVPLSRAQLGRLGNVKHSGGTFDSYRSTIKQAGLVVEQDGKFTLTEAGFDRLGIDVPTAPASPHEVLDMWRPRLKPGNRVMLDALVEAGDWLTREELGERANLSPSGGTFGSYLSMLRTAGLIEEDGVHVRVGGFLEGL